MARAKKAAAMESEPIYSDEVGEGVTATASINGGAPIAAAEVEQDLLRQIAEIGAPDLAAATLTGDLRDFILDRLKHEQSKRPWHERSEADQRDTVHQVEAAVTAAVRRAIELIAGAGRRSIKATLESVMVKDGIKAVLTLSKHDPQRHGLVDSQGSSVLVVVADPDEFTGERAPVEIRPDQAELLGEGVMAQHSEADGAADSPFH